MRYLLIENKGEIHPDALTLMGGSTKRNQNLIGRFGSGNKYSIATLLKNNIDFKIFSGEKEILITTEEHNYRGEIFNKILVNGKETSLTVQMGPDWITWFAIREQLSNALDEGECNVIPSTTTVKGVEGKTRFYIEIKDEVETTINNWNDYFLQDRIDVIYESNKGSIYPNLNSDSSTVLFRKGIQCYFKQFKKSLYHYNIDTFTVTETRVLDNEYTAKRLVCELLATCTEERVIKNILKNACIGEYYEGDLWWGNSSIPKLGESWKNAIGNHRIIINTLAGWFMDEQQNFDCYLVEMELAKRIKQYFPDVIVYGLLDDNNEVCVKKEVELTARMKFLLDEVEKFCKEGNYSIDYPIKVVKFEKDEQLGLADNSTIYISEKCFNMGKREIAATIIEENEHLKTGYKDKTRAFQQHFINLFISQMEERICMFL